MTTHGFYADSKYPDEMKRNPFVRRDNIETLERVKRWPQLKTRFDFVRIYSAEWGAYWRGTGQGYTETPAESAVLSFDAAFCMTSHCGPEKKIEYENASERKKGTK